MILTIYIVNINYVFIYIYCEMLWTDEQEMYNISLKHNHV